MGLWQDLGVAESEYPAQWLITLQDADVTRNHLIWGWTRTVEGKRWIKAHDRLHSRWVQKLWNEGELHQ